MREKKRVFFPILLKVILLGVITSFIASTVAIVVSYNNMIKKAKDDLDVLYNKIIDNFTSYGGMSANDLIKVLSNVCKYLK